MTTTNGTWRHGVVIGLIAYASVALFYAAFDLLAARGTLFTVDLLGKATFRGLRDPAVLLLPITPDLGAVFLYNALHLVVSLAIGLTVMRLIVQAERHPARARFMLVIIVGGFVVTVLAVAWLTTGFRAVLPWWSIVLANALATAVAGVYVLRTRPGVLRRLLAAS